jgi:hypothetical protein
LQCKRFSWLKDSLDLLKTPRIFCHLLSLQKQFEWLKKQC